MLDDHVDRNIQQDSYADSDKTGGKADNQSLCIEYALDILFGCTDTAQDTDFLGSLQNGDIGNNTDHDRRNHE